WMLPHLKDRPLSLQRFPDGVLGRGFFQKDAPGYFPDWIRRAPMAAERRTVRHVLCADAATLVYLAAQAVLTPHVWLSRADRPRQPDRMVFDLDPPEGAESRAALRDAALRLQALLEEIGLAPFLMSTGSRGLHVVVPLVRGPDF